MIKVDQLMEINDLHRQGHAIRGIARITGHSRNTVHKVLRGEHDLKFHTPERTSKLDPYKDYLKQRYEQHRLSAVRLTDALHDAARHRLPCVARSIIRTAAVSYTSDDYQKALGMLRMQASMSRVGCCYDNAVCERFFWSLSTSGRTA